MDQLASLGKKHEAPRPPPAQCCDNVVCVVPLHTSCLRLQCTVFALALGGVRCLARVLLLPPASQLASAV
jgi:hypothetical protein